MSQQDLADRGFVIGARVADERYPYRYGTVLGVISKSQIGVEFDDGHHETVSWLYLAPNGYRA